MTITAKQLEAVAFNHGHFPKGALISFGNHASKIEIEAQHSISQHRSWTENYPDQPPMNIIIEADGIKVPVHHNMREKEDIIKMHELLLEAYRFYKFTRASDDPRSGIYELHIDARVTQTLTRSEALNRGAETLLAHLKLLDNTDVRKGFQKAANAKLIEAVDFYNSFDNSPAQTLVNQESRPSALKEEAMHLV